MLSGIDLKDYRLLRNLSLRDVARYCDVTAQMIGQVETGVCGLTEDTYREIVKGINGASQAIARGTFADEKAKELEERKATQAEKEKLKQESKPVLKKTTARKSTKPTTKKATE